MTVVLSAEEEIKKSIQTNNRANRIAFAPKREAVSVFGRFKAIVRFRQRFEFF